ncbi:MAG: glycine--tRNA ligase, partial [Patescibacteria group bacterium]
MDLMEKVVSLAKRRGFVFPGSEIYGGLAGTWDYGPMGSLMKKNLKDLWWREMVELRDDIVGVDAAIMMNPKAWEASGHVEAFTDPLVECKECHQRFRSDKPEEIKAHEHQNWTEPQKFNLLVKAYLGVIEGKQSEIFLRGEITNGVHVNFKNVVDSTRIQIPFGIAQIGKAFRNEITPGNFTFRSREFEQMEVQFYIKPEEEEGKKWFEYWKQNRMDWYLSLGIKKDNLRFREHTDDERAHYARAATDIEYKAPWGWQEFMGIHHRGDWDLKRHQEYSGQNMTYDGYIPWDIETSAGVDRSLLFLLVDSYYEDDKRVVLKLNPRIAPYKIAVFPLVANKE